MIPSPHWHIARPGVSVAALTFTEKRIFVGYAIRIATAALAIFDYRALSERVYKGAVARRGACVQSILL